MRCIVRVSHIFGLCRDFFLDVHQLKICSSAQETGRMIIQTLVVSAAECLLNVAQLLWIFEAEVMFLKIHEKLCYSKIRLYES